MNFMFLAGFLGADPEVRFTSSGQKVTTLRVATRVRRSGEDSTIWWRVTVWGEQFDKMIAYFKKGSAIMVSGDLNKPEIFTDREGKPQISMSLTATNLMFSPFGRSDRQDAQGEKPLNKVEETKEGAKGEEYAGFSSGEGEVSTPTDDEIPF